MPAAFTTIHIQGGIQNVSFQIGDILYKLEDQTLIKIGKVLSILDSGAIKVENVDEVDVSVDDFLMFAKDMAVNNNSLTGYYAKVEMENTSTEPIELFALSSEATHSSK